MTLAGDCRVGWAIKGVLHLHGPLVLVAADGKLPQFRARKSGVQAAVPLFPGFTVPAVTADAGEHPITGDGVLVENYVADLPAGVEIRDGKLVLTIN